MSMGIKKQRHNTGNSGNINVRRNDNIATPGPHIDSGAVNLDGNSTVNKLKDIIDQKTNISQLNSAMLSLSLQPSSELLPIAEERDSPTSGTSAPTTLSSEKKAVESSDKKV